MENKAVPDLDVREGGLSRAEHGSVAVLLGVLAIVFVALVAAIIIA